MTARSRALLIAPRFFGYEHDIAEAIRRRGYDVDFVDERPTNGSLGRALLRRGRGLLSRRINSYYRAQVAAGRTSGYDVVLVVKAEVVPRWFLERVRADSPGARLVLYTFDSIANSPNLVSVADIFDRRVSFEQGIAAGGVSFDHVPLFYGPEYRPLPPGTNRDYDVAFVGTLHSDRFRFVQEIVGRFPNSFVHLYVPARWYLSYLRLRDPRLRGLAPSQVSDRKLSRAEVADVFRRSRAVLDMQHENQSGLTMRSFETIASGAYLVTTNRAALSSELGATGRVIVVASQPTDDDLGRLEATLRAADGPTGAPDDFDAYSVDAWLGRVLDDRPDAGSPA
ncbi:MAG: hypothetical protein ABIS08_01175 [Pseudolysinimonas sp.]